MDHAWASGAALVGTGLSSKALKAPAPVFRRGHALWSLCSHHGSSLIDCDRVQ